MIYLIRHTQSEANRKNIIGGDYPLTDKGIYEANILKEKIRFKPDVLIVSPLIRAQQTAHILFPEKEFIIDSNFREIYFGDYENTIMKKNEFLKIYKTKPSNLHEISHGDVIKERADKAITKLHDYYTKGENVIISHDTLIRAIICRLKGESIDNMPQYEPLLTNGSILSISFYAQMSVINDNGKIII